MNPRLQLDLSSHSKACGKSYAAQREFRATWLAQKHAAKVEEFQRKRVNSNTDWAKGLYLPISRIWKEQGKDQQGLVATKKYVDNCLSRHTQGVTCAGRPYVVFNNMTERNEFLFLQNGFTDSFSDVRTHSETYSGQADSSSAAPPQKPPAIGNSAGEPLPSGEPQPPTPTPAAKGKAKAKGKASPNKRLPGEEGEPAADPNPKDTKKQKLIAMRKDFGELQKLKQRMSCACSAAADMLALVTTSPCMKGANTSAFLEDITTAKAQVETIKQSDEFWQAWCVQDEFFAFAKKRFSEQAIAQSLRRKVDLEAALEKLEAETGFIKKTYNAKRF